MTDSAERITTAPYVARIGVPLTAHLLRTVCGIARNAEPGWTVTLMTDFYFALGPDHHDVFVVIGEKWILYKHCETEDLAKAIVDGQNKSRGGKDD